MANFPTSCGQALLENTISAAVQILKAQEGWIENSFLFSDVVRPGVHAGFGGKKKRLTVGGIPCAEASGDQSGGLIALPIIDRITDEP